MNYWKAKLSNKSFNLFISTSLFFLSSSLHFCFVSFFFYSSHIMFIYFANRSNWKRFRICSEVMETSQKDWRAIEATLCALKAISESASRQPVIALQSTHTRTHSFYSLNYSHSHWFSLPFFFLIFASLFRCWYAKND